jgi:hypothetical protein
MADFIYNGKHIISTDKVNFPKNYNACSGEKNYQVAKEQWRLNLGPIPEHTYKFQIKTAGQSAKIVASNALYSCEPVRHTQGFIEYMPSLMSDLINSLGLKTQNAQADCQLRLDEFGNRRVPLTALSELKVKRGGFYIHDSKLGETNGCIEVEAIFFDHVQAYQKATNKASLTIEVKYPSEDTITNWDETAATGITKHKHKK